MKKLLLASAIASLGFVSQAHALGSTVFIDPDGVGGMGTVAVTSLNWLAGNAVTVGAGGAAGQTQADYDAALAGPGLEFTTYYQAQLNTFVLNSGGGSSTVTPPGQWTVQATFKETGFSTGPASISLIPTTGTVSIFYNPTVVANDVTGTGYNAGTEILRGSIVGGSGSFTTLTFLLPTLFPVVNLDNFGNNDAAGIQSIQGNGQSTLKIDIGATPGDFINTDFFKSDITAFDFATSGVEDGNDTGQLVDPFTQANPSDQVVGYIPTYGSGNTINGTLANVDGSGTFTSTSDFQFQTTNVTSFTTRNIPEPASLALAGLGLFGSFVFRRRNGK